MITDFHGEIGTTNFNFDLNYYLGENPEIKKRDNYLALKANYIVRWILCELGINSSHNIYTTWGKDDFVYHYCTYNPNEDVKNYNILAPLYLNPALKNYGKSRDGYCHIIRKAHKFHNPLEYIHPQDSLFLDDNLAVDD